MKISRTQIAIIISACILLVMIILSLGSPQPKVTTPKTETKTEEQALPQVGKYQLPAAQENAEPSVTQKETTAVTKLAPDKMHKKTNSLNAAKEQPEEDKGYDSVDSSLPRPQPKLPPPEKMQEMQQRGIVAF